MCCAAFRGICGAGAPAPCTTCKGKDVRAHDASTAWSAGCRKGGTQLGIYASAFDRQTGQHQPSCSPFTAQFTAVISSHQSSSFITLAASGDVCSCHVHALRARPGHSQWRLTLGPRCVILRVSRGAREPALRGVPRSVLGAIVGRGRSCNELTS